MILLCLQYSAFSNMLPLVPLNPMVLLIINSTVFLALLVQDIIKHIVGRYIPLHRPVQCWHYGLHGCHSSLFLLLFCVQCGLRITNYSMKNIAPQGEPSVRPSDWPFSAAAGLVHITSLGLKEAVELGRVPCCSPWGIV